MKVLTRKIPAMLEALLMAGITPMIKGPPAIGKSDLIRQVAERFGLYVIDFRLSQSDATDMNGLPGFNADRTKAGFIPMDTFPLEGDPIPEGYKGWLIFLDEMNSAPMGVQAAAFKLVLDRQVGQQSLHKKVAIICAGNREGDKGIVNRISTPMQSRLAHIEMVVDNKAWLSWAAANDIDHRIMSFIAWKSDMLYTFKPDHNKDTYASPRTWEFCSRLIKHIKDITREQVPLMAAVIDEAAAREFYSYCAVYESMISMKQIIADPENIKVPEAPDVMFALSGTIGNEMTFKTVKPLMTFLSRTNIEFQIQALQHALKREPEIMDHPTVSSWVEKYSKELF